MLAASRCPSVCPMFNRASGQLSSAIRHILAITHQGAGHVPTWVHEGQINLLLLSHCGEVICICLFGLPCTECEHDAFDFDKQSCLSHYHFYALIFCNFCSGFTVYFALYDPCCSILKPICSPMIVPGKFDDIFLHVYVIKYRDVILTIVQVSFYTSGCITVETAIHTTWCLYLLSEIDTSNFRT